ncbi:MAG TPA: hypothetical protein VNL37_04500, partial [Candidatus Polarisedimenticolia bacterium]|nr:hypothetical protein [Candidatus Polarisedimenticolia bacterium]
ADSNTDLHAVSSCHGLCEVPTLPGRDVGPLRGSYRELFPFYRYYSGPASQICRRRRGLRLRLRNAVTDL